MVEEPQGQGGLDGEIRVAPLPTPPAAPAGRPGNDRFRGHPHRHIAAANEGLIVGRPVRNAVLRLIPGMNLRLHPCSVAPAEGPEKCGPRRPTRSGYSCNNACADAHGLPSGDRVRGQPHGDIASLDQRSVVCRPIPDVVFCLVRWVHARLHVEIMHLLSPRWPGGRSWLTEGVGSVHQRHDPGSPTVSVARSRRGR